MEAGSQQCKLLRAADLTKVLSSSWEQAVGGRVGGTHPGPEASLALRFSTPRGLAAAAFSLSARSCLSLFVSRLDPGGELKGSQGLTSCILDSPATQA